MMDFGKYPQNVLRSAATEIAINNEEGKLWTGTKKRRRKDVPLAMVIFESFLFESRCDTKLRGFVFYTITGQAKQLFFFA